MASELIVAVLLTIAFLLQISFSSQKITSVERQLVSVRGSRVILRCIHSLTTGPVYWIHRRPGEPRVQIVSQGVAGTTGDVQHVIDDVNFSHAGNYKCQDQSSHDAIELIVVSDNSSCGREPSSGEEEEEEVIGEQEVVTFICRLTYSGNSAPYLRWTNSDGNFKQNAAAVVRQAEGVSQVLDIESSINVTIGRFDVKPYLVSICPSETGTKCLFFWQSTSLRVFVSVANVTVAMVTGGGGKRALNCSAVGCPAPSYLWEDPSGGRTKGSVVLLPDSLQGSYAYRCIVWNSFRGRNYTAESKIEFYTPQLSASSSSFSDEPTIAAAKAEATVTVGLPSAEVYIIDGHLVRVFVAGLIVLVAIVAFACVCIAAILFSRRSRRQMEPGRRSESKRKTADKVSLTQTSQNTQIDGGLENPISTDIYEEINDSDDKTYLKSMGTTAAKNEGNQYLQLNCVGLESTDDECEIQMPSEYMTTFAVAELKSLRQTLSSEPISAEHYYLEVLS